MTQMDRQSQGDKPSGSVWILWLVAGALLFGCACSLGALFLLGQAGSLGRVRDLWPQDAATATQLPASAPTPTQTVLASLPSPTAAKPTPTPTSTPTDEPTATPVPTRAATARPAATATRAPNPTPFICDSLYELANIQPLAPGQTFRCTIQEQELTDLANTYPESPCSETRFGFDDGEIAVECRMGVRMQASLAAQVQDCRVGIKVLSGTPGFKRVVQELINTQFSVIRYDSICVDQLEIDNGRLTVGGYGR